VKVLFLTNLYPPHVIGGYESLCKEVADAFARRGHAVSVLTSTYGEGVESRDGTVHRVLSLEADLQFYRVADAWSYPRRNARNLQHLRDLVATDRPDIVFVWGLWNLSKRLAREAEALMGSRVVYYLANPWPIEGNMHRSYWDAPATSRARTVVKRLLRLPARLWLRDEWIQVPLRFEHAPCCSGAQRDQLVRAGVPLQDAPVIYEGVDLAVYLAQADRRTYDDCATLSLAFVGILAEHKGVHTAIDALARLPDEQRRRTRLTILGTGHVQYVERLHRLVEAHGLTDRVSFKPPIPREQLPAFLGCFDALLLTSTWAEPLARIMQEGLASGMVVIGSATGGTAETLVHGENGLLFEAGNAGELSACIGSLLDRPALRRSLADGGMQTARERFDIRVMTHALERYLEQVHATVP
jgi:glycogen synthase